MSVKAGVKAASWRDLPVAKRLEHALVKGIDEFAVVVRAALRLSEIPQYPGTFMVLSFPWSDLLPGE